MARILTGSIGNWHAVFILAASLIAILVLKPMRRHLARVKLER